MCELLFNPGALNVKQTMISIVFRKGRFIHLIYDGHRFEVAFVSRKHSSISHRNYFFFFISRWWSIFRSHIKWWGKEHISNEISQTIVIGKVSPSELKKIFFVWFSSWHHHHLSDLASWPVFLKLRMYPHSESKHFHGKIEFKTCILNRVFWYPSACYRTQQNRFTNTQTAKYTTILKYIDRRT